MIKKSELKIATPEELIQGLMKKINIESYCDTISDMMIYQADRGANIVQYTKFKFFNCSNSDDMPLKTISESNMRLNDQIIKRIQEAGFTVEVSEDNPDQVYINLV